MKTNILLKTVFTLLLFGASSLSFAGDIYLSSTGVDTNDGLTAGTAVASFSQAQTLAVASDIIHVSGMIDFSLEPGLTQPNGVAILKDLTIQGASNATDGFDGKNLTKFFSNTTSNLTFKNIKLINGYSGATLNGGALLMNASKSLTCENVIFDGNKTAMTASTRTGAAIQIDNVNGATFKNCVFSNNEASKSGAIYVNSWAANSTILFEACAFTGNMAKESFGGSALYLRSNTSANATCNIINSTFKGNHVNTSTNGGTIYVVKSPNTTKVNIVNCTLSGNTTAAAAAASAGIFFLTSDAAADASVYIKNCIIEGNTTSDGLPADLNLNAASATATGGTTGYLSIENSIIGSIGTSANLPTENIIASPHFNYLTSTSTSNDLKAGLAPFNATNNSYPLYAGSLAIGYGNSTLLSAYSLTDQLGNVRTVGATNTAGSIEDAQVITTTPSAPTALVATAGDGQVSVAFKTAATGGSAVTNYKYSTDNGVTYTACDPAKTTSPIVITGLTNNTAYTVKIKAVNTNGDGAESAVSNEVTPTGTTGLDNVMNKITILRNSNNRIVVNNASQQTGTITVCNAVGQRVVSLPLNATSTTINKSLTSGIYLVMVIIDAKTKTTKIIL